MYMCMCLYVSIYACVYLYMCMCMLQTDRKIYFILSFHFGVNVLRWCLFVHLFDTPLQNSPYSHAEERQ